MQVVGLRYGLIVLSYPVFTFILVKYIIPEYRRNQVNSVFDYIAMKFDRRAKLLGLGIYNIQTLVYLSVTVYAPALALRYVFKIVLKYVQLTLVVKFD